MGGLMIKEDIPEYNLVHMLRFEDYFPENRFRFLVEWEPASLTFSDTSGRTPLHRVLYNSSIRQFHSVQEYGICYFPYKEGIRLLFRKDNDDETPFQKFCNRF